jgi:hypothetical protein
MAEGYDRTQQNQSEPLDASEIGNGPARRIGVWEACPSREYPLCEIAFYGLLEMRVASDSWS